MILTESELRELWRDGRQPLPAFPPGTRFTPAAQDFLNDHSLTPVFALAAGAPAPTLPAAAAPPPTASLARLDTLSALAGLVAAEARRARLPALAAHLDTLAAYAAEVHAAAGQGRPPARLAWSATPTPAAQPPGPYSHPIAHWLNLLRAAAQEAAQAAPEAEGLRPALGRLSAAYGDLLVLFHSGQLAWSAGV